ncbi:hypothetical protein [Leisingera daeponensis]|uniref:hypothetical protein n=1 Tax=Leisingera daeponensis TaxID=405746 RepID=UPI0012B65DB4|nr:hypothetical protein [Leisingera daeponensis]
MSRIDPLFSPSPRASLLSQPIPLERLDRVSQEPGIVLWIRRDGLTALGFGSGAGAQ